MKDVSQSTNRVEIIMEIASTTKYWTIKTKGYNTIYFDIPSPPKITNPKMINVEIIKLIASLVTTEIGIISLGKYTFFRMFPFSTNENADLLIDVAKKVQGIKPQHKNIT